MNKCKHCTTMNFALKSTTHILLRKCKHVFHIPVLGNPQGTHSSTVSPSLAIHCTGARPSPTSPERDADSYVWTVWREECALPFAVDELSLMPAPLRFCAGKPRGTERRSLQWQRPGRGWVGGGGVTALLPGPPFLHREKRQDWRDLVSNCRHR